MRTFKRLNEEPFQIDDSIDGGKDACADALANGAVEIKNSKAKKPDKSWKINDIREYLADNDVDYDRGDSKKELLARL